MFILENPEIPDRWRLSGDSGPLALSRRFRTAGAYPEIPDRWRLSGDSGPLTLSRRFRTAGAYPEILDR